MQNQNVKCKTNTKDRRYKYASDVISFINILPKDMATEVIAKQLLRSATSIGANIVEAHASSSKKDFANFFNHSLKSANESYYWPGLLKDSGKACGKSVDSLLQETKEIANIFGASLLTFRGKRKF